MTDLIKQITADLKQQIDTFQPAAELSDVGTVLEAGDGIARVRGLDGVRSQELVQFANGVIGIAFNLEQNNVGVIIMGEYSGIQEGMMVRATGRIASVPVGDGMVGRVERSDRSQRALPRGANRAERDHAQGRRFPIADRIESDRLDDPDWKRTARIDHWRPPNWEDCTSDRYDYQSKGKKLILYLYCDRTKEGCHCSDCSHFRTIWGDGLYDGRSCCCG
jgi:hypothetical protein